MSKIPGCAKCEALREEAQDEYNRHVTKAEGILYERLLETHLEHERGEHIEKTRESLKERLKEWCTRGGHAKDTG